MNFSEKRTLRLALYQPDMPPNTGAMMRLCACLGVTLDIIQPCGFVLDDKKLRRAGMDYIDHLAYTVHSSWQHFLTTIGTRRLVLLTTKGAVPYPQVQFQPDDILLMGRESAGVPEDVHERADLRTFIPMVAEARSLNVSMAAAIVLAEALRQTNTFPTR